MAFPDLVKFPSDNGKRSIAINPERVCALRDASQRGKSQTVIRTMGGVEVTSAPFDTVLRALDARRREREDGR